MKKILTNSVILAIDFYRNCISRLMLPRCRFYPTCSAYAREAIEKKGLWPGLGMSLKRLLRCHPFSRAHFFDPME
ncbi:MAG: membrane protein insertion efficiency factor YidD [Candidatus Omnitrophica bacterium]|nr:membrane protein insertion efficiency factor YidD [Candidatus Omnitrophota bacterium]MBU3934300.1 membrane protein insertion efficiency factor YidD [Candidatus Omnitrophota bacterium]MBU4140582.1 membrane protein insertion efficiency factor YidD [Candidatus Omnitrophota bacterium]